MNALELLKRDHEQVKELLDKLEDTTDNAVKTREELFGRIHREMDIHEQLEERIFYPALEQHPKAKDVVLEGYEEHHVVDVLMGELTDLDYGDETWGAKAQVMKENIEHHIEEEEDEMFDAAQKVFDGDELDELGERMEALKKELQSAAPG